MAKIQGVDYKAIPKQAGQMRAYGKDLNNQFTSLYRSIDEMRKSWYGTRYNVLVTEFNKLNTDINELLELVVGEIPFTLETVANNYSQADEGKKVTTAQKEAAKKVANITPSTEVGLRFITTEVTTTQNNITKNFQNAKDIMNKIEAEYKKINWTSEASEAFKSQFTKLKNQIVNEFEELNSQFRTLMEQTKTDIQASESSSTVDN